MKPFWREKPFSSEEEDLINAVCEAHNKSSFRQNPSSIVVGCSAQGSGDLCKCLAAGLMALGGPHGPIVQTYDLLRSEKSGRELVDEHLSLGTVIPGWGSSFVKHEIDPLWIDVNGLLSLNHEAIWRRIGDITLALKESGRDIYPNPSAFTAAAAIALEMPRSISPYLLIIGRLSAWTEIFLNETKGH